MDCKGVEELLPAYALNALGAEDVGLVESHLETCPWCASLLRENLHVAASLAMAADAAELPRSLKRETLRRVARDPRGRRRRVPAISFGRLALAGAASLLPLLLAALIAVGVISFRMSDQIDELQEENVSLTAQISNLGAMDGKLEQMFEEQRSVSYIMASPNKETVPLRGATAQGILMISPEGDSALLMAKGLEPSSEDGGYPVWLRRDGQPILVGRLTVDETGWGVLTLWPDQPISRFQQVVVAPEPEKASEGTSSRPVLWGSIVPR